MDVVSDLPASPLTAWLGAFGRDRAARAGQSLDRREEVGLRFQCRIELGDCFVGFTLDEISIAQVAMSFDVLGRQSNRGGEFVYCFSNFAAQRQRFAKIIMGAGAVGREF